MNTESYKSENFLREILFIVFANKRLLIDTIAIIFIAVLAVAFLAPKKYTAQSTLLVKGKRVERNPEIVQQLQEKKQEITREDLNSEAEIIASVEVLKRTIIALAKNDLVFDIRLNQDGTGTKDAKAEEKLIKTSSKLASALSVTVVRSSQVLELGIVWRSPSEGEAILKELVNQYLSYRNAVYKPEETKSFYDQTVMTYQSLIDVKSSEIAMIVTKIKAPESSKEIESNLAVKKDYQLQLGLLEKSRLELTSELKYLRKQLQMVDEVAKYNINRLPGHEKNTYQFFSNINNQAIRDMANIVHLKLEEYTKISRNFVASSERAKSMQAELDKSYRTLIREVRALMEHQENELMAVRDSIAFLQQKISELDARNGDLAQYQMQLEKLQREKRLLEKSYENYYRLKEESLMFERIQNASLNTQIIVLTPAWASSSATFPNKRLLIPFGLVIAVLVALTVAFINEYFDDSIKRASDSERYLGLPTISALSNKENIEKPAYTTRVFRLFISLPKKLKIKSSK
ncbi:GumC family protein [Pseudoalteromonas sp.]|uniref:GumC family protein n=1 Tax=Pseudoalteromonas sp. TaxID=53249 RepID=UPI003563B452